MARRSRPLGLPAQSPPGHAGRGSTPAREGHKNVNRHTRRLVWFLIFFFGGHKNPNWRDFNAAQLSPAGGGESAVADLGVEFCRLDFGVWLAANSVPPQRRGYPDGQTQGSAPTSEKLQEIIYELNNRPKKSLGCRTSNEIFLKKRKIALSALRTQMCPVFRQVVVLSTICYALESFLSYFELHNSIEAS